MNKVLQNFAEEPAGAGAALRHALTWADIPARVALDTTREAEATGLPALDILRAQGWLTAAQWRESLAAGYAAPALCPDTVPPDPALANLLDPMFCLRHAVLPWRRAADGAIVLATANPADFAALTRRLPAGLGPLRMGIALESDIQQIIGRRHGERLAHDAEHGLPAEDSCRDFDQLTPRRAALILALVSATLLGLVLAPLWLFVALTVLSLSSLLLSQALKIAAAIASLRRPPPVATALPARLPVVSILVPLYKERDIASALLKRLQRLTYPKTALDVVLILEEDDAQTQAAVEAAPLPPWMRVVRVPDGQVRTKPRAMNYALNFCRGSIVGIYDAEDSPAPDQIERIVAAFAAAPPDVACLQGMLDYYNPNSNWLARCFTIEYSVWFRVMLPGLERLRLPIPLGGTTVFVRRDVLESVGAWDAQNVTEDADLGLRLARRGFRTQVVPTVTGEEANNRIWPWIKQRSRWLKGYAVTYLVHMRNPGRLWRDLGPRGFIGMQILFLTTVWQFTFAPVLWSFWMVPLGLPHPAWIALPGLPVLAITALFIAAEAVSLCVGALALLRSPHRNQIPYLPTLLLYFPLATAAMYKGLYEMFGNPFYWDKTMHGRSAPECETRYGAHMPEAASPSIASSRSRVTKATEIWSRRAE